MNDIPDAELLRQFARNDSDGAFAELVRRHLGMVYSVARRQVSSLEQAQDIAQAVFLILARKARSLSPKTVLSGWLYRTTRLTAANFRRSEARRLRREQEAYMQSTLDQTASDAAWAEIAPVLEEGMSRLRRTDQDAIVLRFFENKNLHEVGEALGLGERAAQKRVARGLEKLRVFFLRRGVVLTTAIIAGTVSANAIQPAPLELVSGIAGAGVKGAAVGSSMLGLVKAVLKSMAWAKAKAVLVAGASLLLVAGTTTAVVEFRAHSEAISDPFWNDDPKALDAAPPMLILRPSRFPASRTGGISLPNGKMVGRHLPADQLLVYAYNWSRERTILKTRLPRGFFDYLVTLPARQMEALQEELRSQLGLSARFETRSTKVYLVKAGTTTGPGLSLAQPNGYQQLDHTNGLVDGPLSALWYTLECYLRTPVVPEPGLNEQYDAKLKCDAFRTPPSAGAPANAEAIIKAVHAQLGLDLIETNRELQMLTVERAR